MTSTPDESARPAEAPVVRTLAPDARSAPGPQFVRGAVNMGGGNFMEARSGQKERAMCRALQAAGCSFCRTPIMPWQYWNDGAPSCVLDDHLLMLHEHGITPVVLFAHEKRWNPYLPSPDAWRELARAYARRYRPGSEWLREQGITEWGVTIYGISNEPDHKKPEIPPAEYAQMYAGFAAGLRDVDASLSLIVHGHRATYWDVPWLTAVAPMLNDGTLAGVDMHRYCNLDQIDSGLWGAQKRFEAFKRKAGVNADVDFYCTEFNAKHAEMSEDDAARAFLVLAWDMLGVVREDGTPATRFAFPWNIFSDVRKDRNYGLCTGIDPWRPTRTGQVLQLINEKTRGLRFTSLSPTTGEWVLEGHGRRMWVWINWPKWTPTPGTTYVLRDIPPNARILEVWGYDGACNGARQTIELAGQSELTIAGLDGKQCYMFVAR